MAFALSLEDQLTCPICRDLFTDPMVLKCLHSMCNLCLESLKHASLVRWKIECPVCRKPCDNKDIQKDFRLTSLLETHKKLLDAGNGEILFTSPSATSDEGLKLCELCSYQHVSQKCKECDKTLCNSCASNHKQLPSCKRHTLLNLEPIIDAEKKKIQSKYKKLKKYEEDIDLQLKEVNEYKQCEEERKAKAVEEVQKWFDEVVKLLTEHKAKICKKINDYGASEMLDLNESAKRLNEQKARLSANLERFQKFDKESNSGKLGIIKGIAEDFKMVESCGEVEKCKKLLPALPVFKIVDSNQWKDVKSVDVVIKRTDERHSKTVPSFLPVLSHETFTECNAIKVQKVPKKILVNHDFLWCLYDNRVDLYTFDGKFHKSIQNHVHIPNGMAKLGNGKVIIACMSLGLVKYSNKGKFDENITEGNFCDVTCCNKTIYALDYATGKPKLKGFTKQMFRWECILDQELHNDKCNTFNTIECNQTSIFVSAMESDMLMEYNFEGHLLTRINGPRAICLCCSDMWGNILFTNFDKNEVWIYKNDQSWVKLNINGVDHPCSVSIDYQGRLWISNHTERVICYSGQKINEANI